MLVASSEELLLPPPAVFCAAPLPPGETTHVLIRATATCIGSSLTPVNLRSAASSSATRYRRGSCVYRTFFLRPRWWVLSIRQEKHREGENDEEEESKERHEIKHRFLPRLVRVRLGSRFADPPLLVSVMCGRTERQ